MKTLFFFCLTLFLNACDKDTGNEVIMPESLISPQIADLLTMHLIMPEGTQRLNGQIPSTSAEWAAWVTIKNPTLLSSNGAMTPIHFSYNYAHKNLKGFYAQVEGSSQYFKVPYHGISGSYGRLQLPIGIATNVGQGTFSISFSLFDVEGSVSNVAKAWITVLRLGTGSLQVNLTWDNTTDQDLHVYDPMGEEIYSGMPTSNSKGLLDRIDNDGFGPENIYWYGTAPDGMYTVAVKDKTHNGEFSKFMVTINGNDLSRNFTGSTVNGKKVEVVTFTKSGDTITF